MNRKKYFILLFHNAILINIMYQVPVSSVEECLKIIDKAFKNRAVGANDLNDQSSRSHWYFDLPTNFFKKTLR